MDRDPGDQRRASLRASDADREQFIQALRQHQAAGRLTAEELAERTERAAAARTFGELDALATDLPPLRPPAAPPTRPAAADLPSRMRPPGPKRAAARAAMVRSIVWFGMLSVVLLIIWALTGRDYFWPVWPILGFMVVIAWQVFYVWYGPARFDDFDDDQPRPRDR